MRAWALSAISLLQASVADLPFFGTFTRALQFLFVEHSVSGNTTLRIGERAADPRCVHHCMGPVAELSATAGCNNPDCACQLWCVAGWHRWTALGSLCLVRPHMQLVVETTGWCIPMRGISA